MTGLCFHFMDLAMTMLEMDLKVIRHAAHIMPLTEFRRLNPTTRLNVGGIQLKK